MAVILSRPSDSLWGRDFFQRNTFTEKKKSSESLPPWWGGVPRLRLVSDIEPAVKNTVRLK
jgi:hypothetical protein